MTDTQMNVRTLARQQSVDLKPLLDILGLRRRGGSVTEEKFVVDVLDAIPGMQEDGYGNRYLTIGDKPRVLWSCHTDTVHAPKQEGNQNLKWNGDILGLNEGKPGQCLGADDGAGLWLLLELIKAGKPGLYVFHREEEVGRLGSKWIAKQNKDLLKGIDIAIAFDRRGTDSIITHQSFERGCSKEFSSALADALNGTAGLAYKDDDTGSYTDTYSYFDLVPECTNVSTGYYKEHGPQETLDVAHLLRLREALLTLEVDALPVKRDPTVTDYLDDGWSGYGRHGGGTFYRSPFDRLVDIAQTRYHTMAHWIDSMGIDADMLTKLLDRNWEKRHPKTSNLVQLPVIGKAKDDDLAGDDVEYEDNGSFEVLVCDDCGELSTTNALMPRDGDPCPNCGSENTYQDEADAVTGELVRVIA